MSAQSTAVATTTQGTPTNVPQGLIHSPQTLTTQLAAFQANFNVLSPAISISEFAPGYGANLAVVRIDPTVDMKKYGRGTDVYHSASIMGADERALGKVGLLKIAQAAGIQWDPNHCRRMDDGRVPLYWRWQYFGWVRTHDGQLTPVSGSRELDLRDGSAEMKRMTAPQLPGARAAGNELCETKAMLRAIRTLGLKQSYTLDELKKPFLIVRFSFVPDMSDPEIKKLVTERALFGTGALYPHAALPAPSAAQLNPDIDDDEPEPRALPAEKTVDHGRLVLKVSHDMEAGTYEITLDGGDLFTTTASLVASAAAAAKKAGQKVLTTVDAQGMLAAVTAIDAAAAGPIVDELRITSVKRLNGTNKQKGTPWTLFEVAFSNGVTATTFSESLHRVIDEAEKHKLPVTVSTSENERYPDKANLDGIQIVDKRQGTLPMAGDGGKY